MICQTPHCSQAFGEHKLTHAGSCSPSALSLLWGVQWGQTEGGSPDLVLAPQDCCQPRLPRGRPLPSRTFWHRLAWLLAPGTGQWAGGLCCCDLAPSRLPITRGRQPEEWSRSLKCNLWLSGESCANSRGLWASCSPSGAHKILMPVSAPTTLKIPLTTKPIKPAFWRQLAHNLQSILQKWREQNYLQHSQRSVFPREYECKR